MEAARTLDMVVIEQMRYAKTDVDIVEAELKAHSDMTADMAEHGKDRIETEDEKSHSFLTPRSFFPKEPTPPAKTTAAVLVRENHDMSKTRDEKDAKEHTWPISWRQECMPFGDDKSYVETDARSLEEWTAYITNAPAFSNIHPRNHNHNTMDDDDDNHNDDNHNTIQSHDDNHNSDDLANPHYALPSTSFPSSQTTVSTSGQPLPRTDLGLNDGIDMLSALQILRNAKQRDNRPHQNHASSLSGHSLEKKGSLDNDDDHVLAMSNIEMEMMLQQQSALLRQVLVRQATIEHAWKLRQESLFGFISSNDHEDENDSDVRYQRLTIGEGRLAAELRVANNVCDDIVSMHLECMCVLVTSLDA